MPIMDYSFKFYEIAKHYYFPGWHQPYSTVQVLINRAKWDELDDRWKLMWDAVCDRATLRFLTMGEAKNADILPKFAEHWRHHPQVGQEVPERLQRVVERSRRRLQETGSLLQGSVGRPGGVPREVCLLAGTRDAVRMTAVTVS